MKTTVNKIALFAIVGLMFCMIPYGGLSFRVSMHVAALWIGAAVIALFLTDWWRRGFWLLAVLRTAVAEPNGMPIVLLATIALFLLATEAYKRLPAGQLLLALRIAGIVLAGWIGLQRLDLVPRWMLAGPFNPDSAAVLLAMTLPAFWFWEETRLGLGLNLVCQAGILWALASCGSTTGFVAVFSAAVVRFHKSLFYSWRAVAAAGVIGLLAAGFWFTQMDSLSGVLSCRRWASWHEGLKQTLVKPLGHGLGSWSSVFVARTLNDPRITTTEKHPDGSVSRSVMDTAHNEYIQIGFELGWLGLALVLAWPVWMLVFKFSVFTPGLMAVLVASLGMFVFHEAPTALIGCVWIALNEVEGYEA